jgi:hypothetical protein
MGCWRMTTFFARNRTILTAALLMPCAAVLVGAAAPGRLHASTFAVVVSLLIGTAIVVSTTWRHAQAVASLRQELYAIDHPTGANSDRAPGRRRALAIFWLSAALTALIAYSWFA